MTGAFLTSRCSIVGHDRNDAGIYHWTGTTWQQVPGAANQIAVDAIGNPWVVNACGEIAQWTGTAWRSMPGAAKDIATDTSGDIDVIDATSSGLYSWNQVGKSWQVIGGSAVDISLGEHGNLWAITSAGAIFQLPPPADL
jgi:hypothetical protein